MYILKAGYSGKSRICDSEYYELDVFEKEHYVYEDDYIPSITSDDYDNSSADDTPLSSGFVDDGFTSSSSGFDTGSSDSSSDYSGGGGDFGGGGSSDSW